ncbi:AraC family transcriptional regulator [Paenibacillus sp. FSL H7-0331]|uniref:AraC family transcriptional regulator n=1 Tax=Paenibacillus sp. FSL H7-0331 TaxID=1920421 RepID=UPI00096F5F47|nr:AraC family transcriptional regulator [Paenibacillus sp. FSL H7-0331]OMF18190.1 AraC family transcriptional regulator [Paenibacillus sp. FSL H7-0331]
MTVPNNQKPFIHTEKDLFYLDHNIRIGPYTMAQNHSHNSYEIYYLRSGERYYFIKDRSYHVRKGDIVLIQPNVLHKTMQAEFPNHERFLINFREDFIHGIHQQIVPDLLRIFDEQPVIHPNPRELAMAESIIEKMMREQKLAEPGAAGYNKLLLSELLLLLYRHAEQTGSTSQPAEHPTTLHRKVSDIVKYINEHFREPLSLKALAEHFHISSYYLCRIYKEVTGFTVIEYVNQLRVQEAQKLLKTTRYSVTGITEKVGFESSTHFGRIFKSLCGLSPLQYRKWNG